MTLPLETIKGKQYQPVETNEQYCCKCALDCTWVGDDECETYNQKHGVKVIFIEPGDTNEQE